MNSVSHSGIREDIRRRIVAGEWALGEQMPGEHDFALEYECARTTVNRALRALADEGIIERKRKGGTRVRPLPVHQAQLEIPLVREQVEAGGAEYTFEIVSRERRQPPPELRDALGLSATDQGAYLETLHRSSGKPFAFERRWVNLDSVPQFEDADLSAFSANEWLVRTMPFTNGEVSLSAVAADRETANALCVGAGTPLFQLARTTWLDGKSITSVTFAYAPGYSLDFAI